MRFTNLTRQVEIGANCYALEIGGKKVVLDSGLHPKREGQEALPNLGLLADDCVDAIILTHAHQDHVGSMPVLMRRQPRAPVFMTEPTRQLSGVMLHNSVSVMMKKRDEEGVLPAGGVPPLFSHQEVDTVMKRWQSCGLHQRCSLEGERMAPSDESEISFEFYDAGHILGSAGVLIRAEGQKVFYTGDVNFEDQTISQAARFPEEPLDVLIMETTRGDRATPEGFTRDREELRFAEALNAALSAESCVLLPLFALGKTQELLAMFYELRKKRLIPIVPTYIGGLSTKLTELYDKLAQQTPRQHPELQLLDAVNPYVLAGRGAGETPLQNGRVYALSSGMMTEKTLSNTFARRMLSDPAQCLFFVGYADPVSPAGKIRAAQPGDSITVDPAFPPQELRCKVEAFNFSAHASRETLRAYAQRVRPKKVILVHGDAGAIEWFRGTLAADLPGSEIITPEPGVAFEL